MTRNSFKLYSRIISIAAEKNITLRLGRVFLLMYLCDTFSLITRDVKLTSALPIPTETGPAYPCLLLRLGYTIKDLQTFVNVGKCEPLNDYYLNDEMVIRNVVSQYAEMRYDDILLSVLKEDSPPMLLYKKHKRNLHISKKESVAYYRKFFIRAK